MSVDQTHNGVFVSGIDTSVGKTIVSALLVETLDASYWKPIQAGDLQATDTMKVSSLVSRGKGIIHPEGFRLQTPMSPHAAAARENIHINLHDLEVPEDPNFMVVEGAGGLLVPINPNETIFDLIKKLGLPVVLVSRHYLGSINHTLLSLALLESHKISLKALVFNGDRDPETEDVILAKAKTDHVLRLPTWDKVDPIRIRNHATGWAHRLAKWKPAFGR